MSGRRPAGGTRSKSADRRRLAIYIFVGGLVGVLVLHPITMTIYWFELHPSDHDFWSFIGERLGAAFMPSMLGMTAAFFVLGGLLGAGFALLLARIAQRQRRIDGLSDALGADIEAVIAGGESERVEFKSTARWDLQHGKVNKGLEAAIAKTLIGFMNHAGGSLIIGVDDAGSVIGLELDYRTLRRKDRDGFEQLLMTLIQRRAGAHACTLVHPVFAAVNGVDVCRVVADASGEPIYYDDSGTSRYYLRIGNSTRALDIREALAHMRQGAS